MNRLENTHRYDDIIDLPHPVSKKHPQMPSEDRKPHSFLRLQH